ncbi:MAG TPA: hypothetical protein VGZ48_07390 [Candidatus Acidoferrales bacterium]|nr:hypothetical protein [Candidatus Acidoferrales bacterium]
MLPQHYDLRTNAHIMGTAQSGKSKLMEHCVRQHIRRRFGCTIVDFHGTLYQALLEYLAYVRPKQPVILMNLSEPRYVRPLNPFALKDGDEVSAHVNRLASVIVRPWGAENTNELPTYERMVKMMLTFAAIADEPLHHAAKLLQLPKKELRELAVSLIEDDYIRQQWTELQYVKTLSEWHRHVLSTQNRIGRFLASRGILRTIGLKTAPETVANWIERGAIVLVNLRPSPFLDPESGKTFAALLLSEFLNAAMRNAANPKKHFLYLDEAQMYLTNDAAQMLDQVLKSGLRVTLAHHHMGQFYRDPHLQQSIEMNARIKYVFGGLPIEQAKRVAEEFFLGQLNKRWLKETHYGYHTEHILENYEINSTTHGQTESEGGMKNSGYTDTFGFTENEGAIGEQGSHSKGFNSGGGFSSSEGSNWSNGKTQNDSQSRGTRYRPVTHKERDGQEDWGREEKISMLAARLTSLTTRHCFLKLPGKEASEYEVPFVRRYLLNPARVLEYEKALQSTAIPSDEADRILKEQEHAFLERSKAYGSRGASRPTKRPPTLHQQG